MIAKPTKGGMFLQFVLFKGRRGAMDVKETPRGYEFHCNKRQYDSYCRRSKRDGYTNPMEWFKDKVLLPGREPAPPPLEKLVKIRVVLRPRQKEPVRVKTTRRTWWVYVTQAAQDGLQAFARKHKLFGPADAVVGMIQADRGLPLVGGVLS